MIKHMNQPQGDQSGFSTVNVLIVLVIAGVLAVTLLIFIESQRNQVLYHTHVATRQNLTLDIESALQDSAIVTQAMQQANSAAQNTTLDSCLQSASPSSCDGDTGFHLVLPGGVRLAGPPNDEAFFDAHGNVCNPATDVCRFSVSLRLVPSCPPGIGGALCPDAKVFTFHYSIRAIGLLRGSMAPGNNNGHGFVRYAIDTSPFGYGVTLVH